MVDTRRIRVRKREVTTVSEREWAVGDIVVNTLYVDRISLMWHMYRVLNVTDDVARLVRISTMSGHLVCLSELRKEKEPSWVLATEAHLQMIQLELSKLALEVSLQLATVTGDVKERRRLLNALHKPKEKKAVTRADSSAGMTVALEAALGEVRVLRRTIPRDDMEVDGLDSPYIASDDTEEGEDEASALHVGREVG